MTGRQTGAGSAATPQSAARRGLTIAVLASALAGFLAIAPGAHVAQAGSGTPVVTCATDPNIFNTGYDAATGGILPDLATDANWQVAGPYNSPAGTTPETKTYLPTANPVPPASTALTPANVGNLAVGAWSPTPYGNAQWISQQTTLNATSPNGDWYYEYTFSLAPSVTASSFSLDMNFMADNEVATVFVNNVDQSTYAGSNLPQDTIVGDNPYLFQGYNIANASQTTLNHNWQTGTNTIIVQIKSGPPDEGFDAQVRPSALCPVSLAATKTAAPSVYVPGQTLTYTVTVTNGGPGYAAEATVSDPLPAALAGAGFTWTCAASAGSMCTASGAGNISDTVDVAASGTLTYTVTGTVPAGTSGSLSNAVTVTPPAGASDPGCSPNCSSTNTAPQAAPGLSVAKSVTSSAPYNTPGQPIDYQFVVTNTGNVTMTSVGVTDTPTAPAGGLTTGPTCQILANPTGGCSGAATTLAPGQVATFTGSYTISQADIDNGTVKDSATASGDEPGCSSAACATTSVGSSQTVTMTQLPALSVVKSSTTASYSAPGDTIDYSFVVTNTGNVTLSGIAVSDTQTAPATQANLSSVTCPAPTLAPNATETCTATYTVTAADVANDWVKDTATASGLAPGSSTATTSGSSGTTVDASYARVTLTKSALSAMPNLGSNDTFTLVATNAGPDGSGLVVVSDSLPAGLTYVSSTPSNCVSSCVTPSGQTVTWNITNLAVGTSATLQIVVDVTSSTGVNNTATFTQLAPNGSGGNGGMSNTVTLTPQWADVSLTNSASSSEILVGSSDTYTLTATNAAGSVSSSGQVVVSDTLPAQFSYVASTASNCTTSCVSVSGNQVTWTITTLAAGADQTLQIQVTGTEPGATLDSGSFTQAVPSRTGSDTSNVVAVAIVSPPTLAVVAGQTQLTLGQQTTLTYTITNPSSNPVSLTDVGYSDSLAAIIRLASDPNAVTTCTGGTVSATGGSGTVTLSGATLAPGASCTVTVDVVTVLVGSGVDSATVTSSNGGAGVSVRLGIIALAVVSIPTTGVGPSVLTVGWLAGALLALLGALLLTIVLRQRPRET